MQQEEVSERLDSVKGKFVRLSWKDWYRYDYEWKMERNRSTIPQSKHICYRNDRCYWSDIRSLGKNRGIFLPVLRCSRLTCFVVKYYSEREIHSSNIWVESFFIFFFFFAALSNIRVLFFKFQINYWEYFIKDRFERRSGSLVKYFIYRSMK